MKLLAAFFIFIVAVYGKSDQNARINEMMKNASTACVKELNRSDPRFTSDTYDLNVISVPDDPNFVVCVAKKIGVMNEDGTFNLERTQSFSTTDEERKQVEVVFNSRMKECNSKISKDACRMAACVYMLTESKCNN